MHLELMSSSGDSDEGGTELASPHTDEDWLPDMRLLHLVVCA